MPRLARNATARSYSLPFFFQSSGPLQHLHSFPTRRSSDLLVTSSSKTFGKFATPIPAHHPTPTKRKSTSASPLRTRDLVSEPVKRAGAPTADAPTSHWDRPNKRRFSEIPLIYTRLRSGSTAARLRLCHRSFM